MSFERRKRKILQIVFLLAFALGSLYLYMCGSQGCKTKSTPTQFESYLNNEVLFENINNKDLTREYDFNLEGEDVLVFLHMQKTGGTTFGKHLVHDIDLKIPCDCTIAKKRCRCENSKRQIWLFSRYSTGWICGLHADWTELKECVSTMLDRKERAARKRRYLYITLLRDPVQRYMSEWKHVQRGATWLAANLNCNGRSATLDEVPFCFTDEDWGGVSLDEFMACPHNLANNRQTRMLANLSLIGCYNKSALPPDERDAIMLQSAKDNLRNMAFFGLTEYQEDTRYMFERTFHLKFLEDFVQHEQGHANSVNLSSVEKDKLIKTNRLDIELYQYAKQLFLQRLQKLRSEDEANSPSDNPYTPTQEHSADQESYTPLQKSSGNEFDDDEDNTENDGDEYNDLNSHRISPQLIPQNSQRTKKFRQHKNHKGDD